MDMYHVGYPAIGKAEVEPGTGEEQGATRGIWTVSVDLWCTIVARMFEE